MKQSWDRAVSLKKKKNDLISLSSSYMCMKFEIAVISFLNQIYSTLFMFQ